MVDQRPGNNADDRGEMWALGEEERKWMSRMVDRAQGVFVEADNNLEPILPDAERPILASDPDPIVRATHRYPCSLWISPERGRLILRRVFEKAPSHDKIQEMRDLRCTGFCRLLEFNQGASEHIQALLLKIVVASLRS